MTRLSVVVTNHDYEDYLREAIDSALGIDWPDVDVVVVDDASTDGSRDVVRSYGDRVTAVFTDHGNHREAANAGFACSTGDVVVFLDADDVLPTDLARRVAAVWAEGVSKVQFRMQRTDRAGVPFGAPYPEFDPVPTPQDIRAWATRTTAYPTPPGSGNAYARWFLDELFPVGPALGDAADSACLALAPFLGDVVTVPEVLVRYRQHGRNDSDLLSDPERFPREVRRARDRWRFVQQRISPDADGSHDEALFRSRELLQLRIASARVAPRAEPALPRDSRLRMAFDVIVCLVQPGPEPSSARLRIAAWSAAALLAPRPLAFRLVRWRYGQGRHGPAGGAQTSV